MIGFSAALAFVLAREGGRVDDPDDRGGRTAFGVTQTIYDRYRRNRSLPARDVWEIDDSEVSDIYEGIWEARKCDQLPWPLSLAHFDACVNHGPVNAVRMLQWTVGAHDDGVHGPKTQALIAGLLTRMSARDLTVKLLFRRLRFYYDISQGSQVKFLRGWLDRVIRLEEAAA